MNRTPILFLNVMVVATCGLVYELLAGTLASYVLGDSVTQFSLVIGIYKSLQVLYPEAPFADRWVRMPNSHPLFKGSPALSLMVDDGIDGLYRVRRLLDGRRGGWS